MDNSDYILKIGEVCEFRLTDESQFSGTFMGYSSLGGEVAVVVRTQHSKMRFIPLTQIVYIDQSDIPVSREQPKKDDIYYR